jgi:predicted secreted protein
MKRALTVLMVLVVIGVATVREEPMLGGAGYSINPNFNGNFPSEFAYAEDCAKLVVLGWSDDSKYFAFGEIAVQSGSGNTLIGFWLVDAAKDVFVGGATVDWWWGSEPLRTGTGANEFASEALAIDGALNEFRRKVEKYGVSGELLGEKLEFTTINRSRNYDEVTVKSKSGKTYRLTMSKDFIEDNQSPFGLLKGRFELNLINLSTSSKVCLQQAGKYYEMRQGYYIHSAYIDPTETYIAVVTLKLSYGFEFAEEPHFMVNTGRLP